MISQGDKFRPVTITLSSKEEVDNFLEIIRFNNNRRPEILRKFAKKIIQWFEAKSKQPIEEEIHRDFVPECSHYHQDASLGQRDDNNDFNKPDQSEHKVPLLYFVMRVDGTFAITDPQPVEIVDKKIKDHINGLYQTLQAAKINI